MPTSISILHYAAPPVVGGVESTIYHHARLLHRAGYAVGVIAGRGEPFHPQVPFHRLPEADSRHPQVQRVAQSLAAGEVPASFETLRATLRERLRSLLAQSRICMVHNAITLHKNLPLTAALHDLATAGEIHILAWCHDFAWRDALYTPGLHPGYPWDLLRTPWPATTYVTVSDHRRQMLAELLGLPPQEITVAPPGVEPQSFWNLNPRSARLAEHLRLWDAEPLILLPARITRRKNIAFALHVVAALLQWRPRAALVVTGPPGAHNPSNAAYLEELQHLRQRERLEGRVFFLYEHGENGRPLHVTDDMVADLYRMADLLLYPSLREGFGIPVLEAGLARLPVFAADIPPVHESGADFLHTFDPLGSPEETAARIHAFLQTDAAYQLRKRVLRQFTWQAIMERVVLPLLSRTIQKTRISAP